MDQVGIGIGIIGIALIVFFILRYRKRQDYEQSGIRIAGKVMAVERGGSAKSQGLYYPLVRFKLENGDRVTYRYSDGQTPAAYEKGEVVTVIYKPEHPEEFLISGGLRVEYIFLALGIAALGYAVYALVV